MSFRIVTNVSLQDTEYFRSLKGKTGHLAENIFIAEGPKITRVVLESSQEVLTAYLTPEYFLEFEPLLLAHPTTIRVLIAPKDSMEQIVGYALHQGVMLAVRIPESRSIEEAITHWPDPFLVVALDGVADAENMGGIIRTCAAFGVTALLVDDKSCHPYLRRSVRVSMGTIVNLEILRVPSLPNALTYCQHERACEILGTAIGERSEDIQSLRNRRSRIVLFGAEGSGMRPEVSALCDQRVQIPIERTIDSLNVGVACGIVLHHLTSLP